MYVVCFHVCSRPVEGKTGKAAKRQTLEVFKLIHSYQNPELWREVKHLILENGRLDVSTALKPNKIDDLVYVLSIDVAAEDITSLE